MVTSIDFLKPSYYALHVLKEQNGGLGTSHSALVDDIGPGAHLLHACIVKHAPDVVRHEHKCQVMLSIVAHHAAYVVDVLS